MKTVRFTASILSFLSRIGSFLFLATAIYAIAVVVLAHYTPSTTLPIKIKDGYFTLFFPFTHKAFLLGDYSQAYLFTYLFTVAFYGFFLWLLSDVFTAFRQQKLFTQKSVARLSRFYISNLLVPIAFLALVLIFRSDVGDLIRIMFLHVVIGVFAFFMAALFKQGLILQEEQDLTF